MMGHISRLPPATFGLYSSIDVQVFYAVYNSVMVKSTLNLHLINIDLAWYVLMLVVS